MLRTESWLITTSTPEETAELAGRVARCLRLPLAIGLSGTLGAGKTCFVQGLARCWGAEPGEVTSPTFTLWQTYATVPIIHHLDTYRIESEEEFWELGIEEVFERKELVVVEWADKYESVLPEDTLWIDVKVNEQGDRVWQFQAGGGQGKATLGALKSAK
jgi:tRNA threonylcarbamoyladenosine biosynthesis protein TsaE